MKFKISQYAAFAKAIAEDTGISSENKKLWAKRISELLSEMKTNTFGDLNKTGFRDYIMLDFKSTLANYGVNSGAICELGGPQNSFASQMPEYDFKFLSLYKSENEESNTSIILGDATQCDHVPSESFDAVFSVSVFEHISKPWKAAEHITRILKPGGISYHAAPFSYFYHGAPNDYWRYTPDAFQLIFSDLKPIKAELYGKNRRRDNRGSKANPVDQDGGPDFAVDGFGGWRENWFTIYAGQKDPNYFYEKLDNAKKQVIVNLLHVAIEANTSEKRWHNAALEVQEILTRVTINHEAELTFVPKGEGLQISLDEIKEIWRSRESKGPTVNHARHLMAKQVGFN